MAGWNTYAQIQNTVNAIRYLPIVFEKVGEAFSGMMKGDGKSKLGVLALVVALVALAAGFLIAYSLIRHWAGMAESYVTPAAAEEVAR